jgi:hypothetical protein
MQTKQNKFNANQYYSDKIQRPLWHVTVYKHEKHAINNKNIATEYDLLLGNAINSRALENLQKFIRQTGVVQDSS